MEEKVVYISKKGVMKRLFAMIDLISKVEKK
jgi:hypothetical protein